MVTNPKLTLFTTKLLWKQARFLLNHLIIKGSGAFFCKIAISCFFFYRLMLKNSIRQQLSFNCRLCGSAIEAAIICGLLSKTMPAPQ